MNDQTKPPPLPLTPIPWGKPDRELAFAVCSSIFDTTPPIIIQWNPIKDYRIRRALRFLGVAA